MKHGASGFESHLTAAGAGLTLCSSWSQSSHEGVASGPLTLEPATNDNRSAMAGQLRTPAANRRTSLVF
jgi:hypothetical protein